MGTGRGCDGVWRTRLVSISAHKSCICSSFCAALTCSWSSHWGGRGHVSHECLALLLCCSGAGCQSLFGHHSARWTVRAFLASLQLHLGCLVAGPKGIWGGAGSAALGAAWLKLDHRKVHSQGQLGVACPDCAPMRSDWGHKEQAKPFFSRVRTPCGRSAQVTIERGNTKWWGEKRTSNPKTKLERGNTKGRDGPSSCRDLFWWGTVSGVSGTCPLVNHGWNQQSQRAQEGIRRLKRNSVAVRLRHTALQRGCVASTLVCV